MGYESFAQINNLEEVSFIAGTEFTFNFTVYQEDGVNPVNLNAATINWVMAYYGMDEAVVTKTIGDGITITGENTFRVVVDSNSTRNLQGKFVHQAQVTDFNNSLFIPGQGIINLGTFIQ